MSRRKVDAPDLVLFDTRAGKTGPGPVYQGVSKQIRALETDLAQDDKARIAGLAAAARSIAASIDRCSGHDDPRNQASGMQLAALHTQLREHLIAMTPAGAGGPDKFDEFLADLAAPHQGQPSS